MRNKKLKPMLKWTGGKSQELSVIQEYMPEKFENYYEPFIGGGAVWFAIDSTTHNCFVNDYSKELILFYNFVKDRDANFIKYIEEFSNVWEMTTVYMKNNGDVWKDMFLKYRKDEISLEEIKIKLEKEIINNKELCILFNEEDLLKEEYQKRIIDKIKRIKINDTKKEELPDTEIVKNIESGFKAALYMSARKLYNNKKFKTKNIQLWIALYFIMRNYSYSGMFRYNSSGGFNVPFGGISYMTKDLRTKLKYYQKPELLSHLNKSTILQGDFEDFLRENKATTKDFIFLDPPYDSEFSAYEGNKFEAKEQIRLANYFVNECKAKWMMVIKYTDFIYDLYNKSGINIIFFDKKYAVSFMGRNERETQHIIIKNY